MLKIYEDFYSIQGEGPYQGYPAIFIRVAGCNLNCVGFGCKYVVFDTVKTGCDTWYAVDPDIYNGKTLNLQSNEDVDKYLTKLLFPFVQKNKPIIVITGGEPLIYQETKEFYRLISSLEKQDFIINIETNGTIIPLPWLISMGVVFSTSIKLSNAGGEKEKRIKGDVIEHFSKLNKSIFKFVVEKIEDIEEVLELIFKYGISMDSVWLMPKGENKEKILENTSFVMNTCAKYGFKYSSRLHLLGNIK